MKRKRDSIASNTLKGVREAKEVDDPKIEPLGPSFADLPSPITTNILLRLPIKSVLICKCVCSSWNTIISDPHFAKLHFECAPVDFLVRTNDPKRVSRTLHLLEFKPEKFESQNFVSDNDDAHFCSCEDFQKQKCNSHMKLEAKFKLPIRDAKMVLDKKLEAKSSGGKRAYIACKPRDDKFAVVNSCNGLLCLCDPKERNPLVVCNPVTGEFIRLPKASKVEKLKELAFGCGFGFLEKTNEYKVIRVYGQYVQQKYGWRHDYTVAEIHTLGSGLWRSIEFYNRWHCLKFPTCLNGSLHWLGFDCMKRSIVCFNLESERFHLFPSPPHELVWNALVNSDCISLGELKGCLYICGPSSSGSVNLWVMREYGVGESWSKVLSIDTNDGVHWPRCGLYQPMKAFIGPGILMYHSCNCFTYYERRKRQFQFFKVCGTQFDLEVIAHIPSLISLKDAIKGDNVEVLNVHSRCAAFKLREEKDVLFLAQK